MSSERMVWNHWNEKPPITQTPSAEDLRQDVFVSLWRKIGTFRGEAAFATWLHRFTVNQVLMYWRKRRARPEEPLAEGGLPAEAALVA